MKQWSNNDERPTPPESDDDGLSVIEGESYIKEGGGFTTNDDDEIEPSQMDKIVT